MFHMFRDDARRRITVQLTGLIGFGESAAFIEQQLARGAWSYGVLYDARTATGIMAVDDAAPLAAFVDDLNHPESRRGAIAVVTTHPDVYAFATAYQQRMQAVGVPMAVFTDIADAERWLDEHADGPAVSERD